MLVEGFRPGVAERLGIGPDVCCERNPRLVYARITGWGQEGPLARTAGHDINYIALSGLLHQIGNRGGKPVPPLNVVGDYGGGGLMAAFGILAALFERGRSGRGQVVDATMIDSMVSFMAVTMGLRGQGLWRDAPGANFLSGAAHFYDTYETRDGKWLAVGAIEPQFHALLLEKLGLDPKTFATGVGFANQPYEELVDRIWPELKEKLAAEIAQALARRTGEVVRRDGCVRHAGVEPGRGRDSIRTTLPGPYSSTSTGKCRTHQCRVSAVVRLTGHARRAQPGSTLARFLRSSAIGRKR